MLLPQVVNDVLNVISKEIPNVNVVSSGDLKAKGNKHGIYTAIQRFFGQRPAAGMFRFHARP